MKLLEEVGIRFLIGIFIAVLIGFLFWYLVIHNETDRIVERSFQRFYNALDEACQSYPAKGTKDKPVEVYVEIPQKKTQNFLQQSWDNLMKLIQRGQEKSGQISPAQIIQKYAERFGDPYYKFYWETFPPEPPYTLGDIAQGNIAGTLAAFFMPWSEDLPWSSNLLFSMAFATAFLGIDFLKVQSLKNMLSKGYTSFKREATNFISKILDRLEDIKYVGEVVEVVEKAGGKLKVFLEKLSKKMSKVKDLASKVLDEFKFTAKTTLIYTGICLAISDENLQNCLVYGALGATLTTIAKIEFREHAWPKIKHHISAGLNFMKGKFKNAFSEVKDYLKETIDSFKEAAKNLFDTSSEHFKNFMNQMDILKNELEILEQMIKEMSDDEDSVMRVLNKLKEIMSKVDEAERYLEKLEAGEFKGVKVSEEEIEAMKASFSNIKNWVEKYENWYNNWYDNYKFVKEWSGLITINALDQLTEEIADTTDEAVKKVLINKGFEPDDEGKLVLDFRKTDLEKNNFAKDLKEAIESRNYAAGDRISEYEGFKIEYDENGNALRVIYNPKDENSISSLIKKYFLGYSKKFLGMLASKLNFIHDKMIDGEVVADALKELKDEIIRNDDFAERMLNALKKYGIKSKDQLIEMLDETIKKYESGENMALVVSKQSVLGKVLDELAENEKMSPRKLYDGIRTVLHEIENGNIKERDYLYGLLKGKTLRIREDIAEILTENPIGYSALRAIDMYTPLGMTYWDRYFSYYGYEGQKTPEGCQPNCEEDKICLQLGACVRQFDLPESCQKIGIRNVKLDRDSIVAADPRFYLVSPCYSKLQIYIDSSDATIFIKPILDKQKLLSEAVYCYATEGYVNTYITTFITEHILDIAANFLGPIGPIVNWFVNIGFDAIREGLMAWPYVYQLSPTLAS